MAASSGRRHIQVAYEEEVEGGQDGSDGRVEQSAPSAQTILDLKYVAVLPEPGDNCAILRERLEQTQRVRLFDGDVVTVDCTVLEGHRLAVVPVKLGGYLLSWGLPFGRASRDIAAGEYLCNETVLATLRLRQIEGLPEKGNFEDVILPHSIDESHFHPAEQVPLLPAEKRLTFRGFDRREAQGGVGTRNFIAIVPTSALSSPFARRLAESLRLEAGRHRGCDGVVAMAHTEAAVEAGGARPKNWELLLRTLGSFVSHPNVAAALVVGHDGELLQPGMIREYIEASGLKLPAWSSFLTLSGRFAADLEAGRSVVLPWLPEVAFCERSDQPLSQLRVALQCGGSDAFSGVSGNPAAGFAAKLLIEHGGAAVLAETDELIGAESYILAHVRDLSTAQKFLSQVARFKERFFWHGGQSAENNPSGGNKLRGLYNIALKSLGAAKKKHAEVSLDGVLEYGERLDTGRRGYFFMDSPGNDLESIAGQVASGCNMIFFITGNGSVTNFPFVPTQKIITTSQRYELLKHDMDFNAGRFQDEGIPMASLGEELFKEMLRVASGELSLGERAGHSQVSIWREWAQEGPPTADAELAITEQEGVPLVLQASSGFGNQEVAAVQAATFFCTDASTNDLCRNGATIQPTERLGLVLPTSLCSGEVARRAVEELEAWRKEGLASGGDPLSTAVDRFVALPHTEGCGIGYAGDGERLFSRVMFGHLLHANVVTALLLEHGCEKNHNAWMVDELQKLGVDPRRFGSASVQLDGGVDSVLEKVKDWFQAEAAKVAERSASDVARPSLQVPLARLPLALLCRAADSGSASGMLSLAASLARGFIGAGGTVIVPSSSVQVRSVSFLDELCSGSGTPSLAFAQSAQKAGLHVMHIPAGVNGILEELTGLVAAGAGAAVVLVAAPSAPGCKSLRRGVPVIGHPMVPVLYVCVHSQVEDNSAGLADVYDLVLRCEPGEDECDRSRRWMQALLSLLSDAASRQMRPRASEAVGFQVARGPTGVSA